MIACTDTRTRCDGLAWPWLALGAFLAPCPPAWWPCLCGCSVNEHDEDGCSNEVCWCSRWQSPGNAPRPTETTLSTQAACADACTCGGEHHDGALYYVSAARGSAIALLLGPYATHSVALAMVDTALRLADRANPYQAIGLAVGTVACSGGEPGVLNGLLDQEERKA